MGGKIRGIARRGGSYGKGRSILVSPKNIVSIVHQGPNNITNKFASDLSNFSSENTPSSSLTPTKKILTPVVDSYASYSQFFKSIVVHDFKAQSSRTISIVLLIYLWNLSLLHLNAKEKAN